MLKFSDIDPSGSLAAWFARHNFWSVPPTHTREHVSNGKWVISVYEDHFVVRDTEDTIEIRIKDINCHVSSVVRLFSLITDLGE